VRLAIHIPCWKRLELFAAVLQHINRLDLDHDVRVCVAGSEGSDSRSAAESHGAWYVEVPNSPLGTKANAAVQLCREHNPDGIIGMGSDDFVTAPILERWADFLDAGVDYMGVLDIYAYSPRTRRLRYWPGYEGFREGEPVGPARCHSARLMECLDWQPFNAEQDYNLDGGMTERLKECNAVTDTIRMADVGGFLVDVKTGTNINPMPPGKYAPHDLVPEALGWETADAIHEVPCRR
jgi:hypothetical protein